MSNFDFLSGSWPLLAQIGAFAEANLHDDPNTTLFKLRMLIETLTKYIYAHENLVEPVGSKQVARLNDLKNRGVIPDKLFPLLHAVRKSGNKATHEAYGSMETAETCLKFSWQICSWFSRTYSDSPVQVSTFKSPEKIKVDDLLSVSYSETLEERLAALQSELETLKASDVSKEIKEKRKKRSWNATKTIHLSETETRQLIDLQLNQAGWEADSQNLRYAKGSRPQKNKNMAIAEWPTNSGPADYALFIGKTLVGIVEAKKKIKDVAASLNQVQRYSKAAVIKDDEGFLKDSPWGDYKIPFMFSTNGQIGRAHV